MNYFNKVGQAETKHLWNEVKKYKIEFSAKIVHEGDAEESVFKLKIVEFTESGTAVCHTLGKNKKVTKEKGEMVVLFYIGGEKFFLQTKFFSHYDDIFLDITSDIFILQRREDFRIKIPESYNAKLIVQQINENLCNIEWILLDLSGGGAKVKIDSNKTRLKHSDRIKAFLYLKNQEKMYISAKVVHQHLHSTTKDFENIGLQFVELNNQTKDKIISFVMDLYRQLFAKIHNP